MKKNPRKRDEPTVSLHSVGSSVFVSKRITNGYKLFSLHQECTDTASVFVSKKNSQMGINCSRHIRRKKVAHMTFDFFIYPNFLDKYQTQPGNFMVNKIDTAIRCWGKNFAGPLKTVTTIENHTHNSCIAYKYLCACSRHSHETI